MVQYQVLFEVSLSHNYYSGSFSKDYEIIMTPSLQNMMRSYQLIFKKKDEGFSILGKSDQLFLISSSKEAIKFRFGIQIKNRFFENFSEIRPRELYMKYIFRNEVYQDVKSGGSNTKEINLHFGRLLSDSDFNFCLSGNFKPNKVWGSEITLSNQNGSYFEGEVDETILLEQLLTDDYGSYQVKSSEVSVEDDIFYFEPELKNSWGIIEISLQSSPITKYEKVVGSHFKINIDARKVFWTYFFVSSDNNYYNNVSVLVGKNKLDFSEAERVLLPNNQVATKITSQKAIYLSKFYAGPRIYAELRDIRPSESKERGGVNKVYLPTPDVKRIKAIVDNGETKFYSEMYIQNL